VEQQDSRPLEQQSALTLELVFECWVKCCSLETVLEMVLDLQLEMALDLGLEMALD